MAASGSTRPLRVTRARSTSSSRLSLRLAQLPHDALAELAARLCAYSPALQATAEECMAGNKPLSHELVERVLLSPDLMQSILGPLETKDGAAAAVCKQWLAGWTATNEPPWPRRRLKHVPLDLPEELDDTDEMHITAGTSDGRLLVAVYERGEVHILDRSMRLLQLLAGGWGGIFAASDDAVFHVRGGALCRTSYDATIAAEYDLEWRFVYSSALASCGVLFCAVDGEEIIAFDAQTLQPRHCFGRGLLSKAHHHLNGTHQLAVVGDELFVCDTGNDRLQVFSFTGEHRRSITGKWRRPQRLCFAKERLYLVEQAAANAYDSQGRRILVLSLQGDILQVVRHPSEPTTRFTSVCCFDRKLLASFVTPRNESAGIHTPKYGMLALRGL